ncbi:TIM barrel protein [uncultured Thiothrix sp.]|uniref:TIM barrel protein n=1 Tax=uncultured Thiothrix sp. TaxID=223185 RepID=UPI002618F94B|nr:TIM barrel protein [uncultured Thiothrix sp.]
MSAAQPQFSLNHMTTPNLSVQDFFALSKSLGIDAVEIRNDLRNNAIIDGTPAEQVKQLAQEAGVKIVSINALQRFNEWTPERQQEAIELADYAQACGSEALVLVPVNDGSGKADGQREANLRTALGALKPILASRGLIGLVEPLGFEICSQRSKKEVVDAIKAVDGLNTFRMVHDTFHHHLAGEGQFFPELTGLVHISGVADQGVPVSEMRDPHRVFVDSNDKLGNIEQINTLLKQGYKGYFSFELFSGEVHKLSNPAEAIQTSIDYIRQGLSRSLI